MLNNLFIFANENYAYCMKEDEILYYLKENNRMLREIIEFINSLGNHLHHDNVGDFLRNIMANFISDKMVSK